MIDFTEAKKRKAELEAESERASCVINDLSGGGPMGLTRDEVRSSPEWQTASREYNVAATALRAFNSLYMRRYKREFAEDRRQRRQAKVPA